MFLKHFFNELKAWKIVRREYKKNKKQFDAVGLKCDWGGRLYRVINRDPEIALGSDEDEIYLRKELAEIWSLLVKLNLVDILAYELKPLEEERQIDENQVEYEHGYLVTLTPAWNLNRQYVTFWSVLGVTLFFGVIIAGITYSVIRWLIPYIQTLC